MNPLDIEGGEQKTVNLTLFNPREINVANCVSARTDRGISIRRSEGSGVLQLQIDSKGWDSACEGNSCQRL